MTMVTMVLMMRIVIRRSIYTSIYVLFNFLGIIIIIIIINNNNTYCA